MTQQNEAQQMQMHQHQHHHHHHHHHLHHHSYHQLIRHKMSFIIASLFVLLISTSAFSARVEAKPLNQNQVKFRRLPPKEFSAAIGSSITIECEAGSSPPPTIHWLKNGKRILQNDFDDNQLEDAQPIQVDDVNKIALSSTRSRLFIDCANFQDEAIYTCVAENAFSRISSHTKLNLIKQLPDSGSENDLLASGPIEEEASALDLVNSGGIKAHDLDGTEKSLSALPQCLSQRSSITTEPVRIHMWTHNIVEIMKNNIILYCRSNIKKQTDSNSKLQLQSQETTSDLNSNKLSLSENQQQDNDDNGKKKYKSHVTWTLPDDKLVDADQKDKFEILETGDLLIKDLRWADMGSYVCTVSDERSSDSISTFVYPASIKINNRRPKEVN